MLQSYYLSLHGWIRGWMDAYVAAAKNLTNANQLEDLQEILSNLNYISSWFNKDHFSEKERSCTLLKLCKLATFTHLAGIRDENRENGFRFLRNNAEPAFVCMVSEAFSDVVQSNKFQYIKKNLLGDVFISIQRNQHLFTKIDQDLSVSGWKKWQEANRSMIQCFRTADIDCDSEKIKKLLGTVGAQ